METRGLQLLAFSLQLEEGHINVWQNVCASVS